jgi:uncharacterized repeat protein (TIGR01451 family)
MQAKWRKAALALAVVTVGALFVTAARAYVGTNGLFELDGDVADSVATPGDDWATIYAGTSTTAFATAFVTDTFSTAENSFFTGGGSKDVNDVSEWLYDTVNDVVPDKDDLEHVFAAGYDKTDCYPIGDPNCTTESHSFFYFGADRFDAGDGSAQVGFWFFKQPVFLNPLEPGKTTGTFNGVHTVGDLLVLLDFVKGGGVGAINVYQWVGGKNPLLNIFSSPDAASVTCTSALAPVCEVINTVGGEVPPWSYTYNDTKVAANTYAPLSFLEAGIDATLLLGHDIGCFSSFLAETRSSGSSTTAQLKDFALGQFGVCSIGAQKTGPALSKAGDTITYTVTVTNTGRETLYLYSATDTLGGTLVANGVKAAGVGGTCSGGLAPAASCTLTYPYTIPAGAPDPLRNVVTVTYREHSDFQTAVDFSSTAEFTTNLFSPSVSVQKTGDTLFVNGQTVHYAFTITNTSSVDSPNLVLDSVTDDVLGTLSAPASCSPLAPGASCSFTATRVAQAGDPDALTNTVTVHYHPAGFPNDVAAHDSHTVNRFSPSLRIEKSGPPLAKLGDGISYHYKITNTSSSNTPALTLVSLVDDKLGDLAGYAPVACDVLAVGAWCEFDVPWTVAGAGDPITNTVTAIYSPSGYAELQYTATASHDLNLFQPSIAFSKTADTALSKVGDKVNYTLALNNTSSSDTPSLVCTITDAKLGVSKNVTLAPNATDTTHVEYTIQASDADPLFNEASVTCHPTGWPNTLTATGQVTVNLFQPSVSVAKGVNKTVSKLGDTVVYTYTITNTSSTDAPTLTLFGVSDDVVGDLLTTAQANGCANLAHGASCTFSVPWTVSGTADPVVNTVTVHYHPNGFPNDVTAHASASLPLFAPSISLTKVGDRQLSKVGDVIAYTITVANTSTAKQGVAIPAMVCTIVDTMLGVNKNVSIAAGGSNVTTVNHTVVANDPDPLVNTATATCHPDGFPNVLSASGNWSVDLFQASVDITKSGPTYSKPGDTVQYTVTVTNTSGPATPDLVCTVTDPTIGLNQQVTLALGASQTFSPSYTIPAGNAPTLVNEASVDCTLFGGQFPNHVTDKASFTTNLLHPNASVSKTCTTPLVPIGGEANFHVIVANTGDADLISAPSETTSPAVSGAIAVGGLKAGDYPVAVPAFPLTGTVSNTIHVDFTLAARYGLPNAFSRDSADSCTIMARAKVIKTSEGLPPLGTASFTFQLRQGASLTQNGTILETGYATAGNGGNISFVTDLVPGQTYQLCELIQPAWMTTLGTFVPGSFMPPDGYTPNPNVDNSILCGNFVPTAGTISEFTVDNTPPPGGNALTIGYWKNHASCKSSNGKQDPVLDQILAQATPPGIQLGSYYLTGDPLNPDVAPSCSMAVTLLDKTDLSGKKRSSDPLFNMVAQLIAAELNYAAQAYMCGPVTSAIASANALLVKYHFNGYYPYSPPKLTAADALLANNLAKRLDDYNNDRAAACQ